MTHGSYYPKFRSLLSLSFGVSCVIVQWDNKRKKKKKRVKLRKGEEVPPKYRTEIEQEKERLKTT